MNAAELLELVKLGDLLGNQAQFSTCTLQAGPPRSCASPDEVNQALDAFAPEEGWLCGQDAVKRFLNGEPIPEVGVILYGEVRNRERALHIQQNGRGGWTLVSFHEQPGSQILVETTRLIAETDSNHAEPRMDLLYRVYWAEHPEQGWRQIAAAFNGFQKVEC